MEYKKIESPTLKELFMEEIEGQILSGEMKAGEKLPPEREIAQNMHISRSVVNSAIVEMERKGFLKTVPRKGTYVLDYKTHATPEMLISIINHGALSRDYIRSILEVRDMFMCQALGNAVSEISDEQIALLEQAFADFKEEKTPRAGAAQLYKIDCLITEFSGNVLLPILVSSFKVPNTMLFERYLRLYGSGGMNERNRRLLSCIKARDTEGAVGVMRRSIKETIDGSTQIYEE